MATSNGGAATGVAETIEKLTTLQNLVKRDPETYSDEFALQHKHFLAELEIFKMNPSSPADTFIALVGFLSHVSACYKSQIREFPSQLVTLLTENADILHSNVRHCLVQALFLMRNKGLLQPVPLLKVFFSLFRVKDKFLREMVFTHIVHDIKNINKQKKDEAGNRSIQNFMYNVLKDDSVVAAKKSLDVMIELYRRRVWVDERTVNVIASAMLLGKTKLLVCALKFFLGVGSASAGGDSESDDDDDDDNVQLDPKQVRKALQSHAHSKHTVKRQRHTFKLINGLKKNAKKALMAAGPVFPAIQLVHDPQGLAEKLFNMLRSTSERFEVRLMLMNFVSRLIGQHKLILLPVYSFLQKYLAAHQQNVTQVLAYLVQACHDLVPPDEVVPVIRTIANNFVNDRCTPELIQVGLNAIREVIAHCPVVLEEEGMKDLVSDFILYRKYSNKGVVSSARALLNLIREIFPAVLRRKDWGREVGSDKAAAANRPTAYGQQLVATGIDGADLLALALARKAQRRGALDSADAIDPLLIAKMEDEDEWEAVARAKVRELKRKGKKVPKELAQYLKKKKKSSAAAAEEDDDLDSILDESDEDEAVHGAGDEMDLEGDLVPEDSDEDVDDDEDDEDDDEEDEEDGVDDDDDDEEEEDDDDDEDDEEDEDDDEDDEDDEEEEEGKGSAALPAVSGKKRPRQVTDDYDSDEAEDVLAALPKRKRANSDVTEVSKTVSQAARSAISGTSKAGSRASLAATLGPLLGDKKQFQLEATRFLTPKDFERIKKIREQLAGKGMTDRDAADIIRIFSGNDLDGTTQAKKKRRGGRNLGYASDEVPDESESEEENQMAIPGATFAPPVATVEPSFLESDITKKKRRAAERLAGLLEDKSAKYEGKKPGGGMTNREKARKKNYLMLRKSTTVQQKLKKSLVLQERTLRHQLNKNDRTDKRTKQRRRRT